MHLFDELVGLPREVFSVKCSVFTLKAESWKLGDAESTQWILREGKITHDVAGNEMFLNDAL